MKKSDVEIIFVVLGSILLGLTLFISIKSLIGLLAFSKSSLVLGQFLEGSFLTSYYYEKYKKELIIDTNVPIYDMKLGKDDDKIVIKINNICYEFKEDSLIFKILITYSITYLGLTYLGVFAYYTYYVSTLPLLISKKIIEKIGRKKIIFLSLGYFTYEKIKLISPTKICKIENNEIKYENMKLKVIEPKKIGQKLVFNFNKKTNTTLIKIE